MSSKDVSALILDKFFNSRDEKIIYLSLSPKFQESLEILLKDQFGVKRFYDMKKGNLAFEPYSPFLSLLRDSNLSGETVRDSVLKIQENDFVTWFQGRPLEFREDVPVIDEIFFERDSCIQSILKMLRHTEDSVVIFNAQEMADEGFEVLGGLEKNGSEGKFIFCFDSSTLASLCFDNPVFVKIPHHTSMTSDSLLDIMKTDQQNTWGCTTVYKQHGLPNERLLEQYRQVCKEVHTTGTSEDENNIFGIVEYTFNLYSMEPSVHIKCQGHAKRVS